MSVSAGDRSESGLGFGAPPDAADLWTFTRAPAQSVSFAVDSALAEEAPVCRIDLPADPDAAAGLLSSYEDRIASAERALGEVAGRLDTFVHAQSAAPSFGPAAPGAALGQAEAELLALLGEAQTGQPAVSFGLGDAIAEGLDKAIEQFQAFVDRTVRAVTHYAWVETQIQGRLVCRTAIGWTGDTNNLWLASADPATRALHMRSVRLAVDSRNQSIRTFVAVAQGAAQLAALVSAPGGAVLALPAAWKFVNRVLDEINKRQDGAISP